MRDLHEILGEMAHRPIFSRIAVPALDMRGSDGSTPLHCAAWFNDTDAATAIIAAGADVNASDNNGQTPLRIAIESGHSGMACLLVGQGASLPDNNDDQSALNMLLGPNHDGQLEPLPALLLTMWDLPEFIGLRPTHSNVVGHSGDTPLHVAVRWKDLEAVKLLLAACADPNVRGDESYTPLHSACSDADPAMVELLISYGADLFAETRGNLPFTIARLFRHDHLCDLLGKYRDNARATDPQVSIKSRIR